jgi:hypothetical protein
MLFLANITTLTTYSPGDDGMRGPFKASFTRLVEAEDSEQARDKAQSAFEQDREYIVLVEVEVEISEIIK